MVSFKQFLAEARYKIVRARVRAGKVQRKWRRLSNVKGYTIRSGRIAKMSAAEKRHRHLSAIKAARKRIGKMSRIVWKHNRSVAIRNRILRR